METKVISGQFGVHFKALNDKPILLAMSGKDQGDMSQAGGLPASEKREMFCREIGVPAEKVFIPGLVHRRRIISVDDLSPGFIAGCDGLVTTKKNIFLSVKTADCPWILLFNPVEEIICLIHSGWKGLSKGIIRMAISICGKESDILAFVGPFICKDCYEFGSETFNEFLPDYKGALISTRGKSYLDIGYIVRDQLMSRLLPENIFFDGNCTFSSDNLFSYRRWRKIGLDEDRGMMMTVVGMV